MSVFTPTKVSHLKQPMFLGEPVDVARFDELRLPWLDKLTEKQLSFFWRPEEVDLTKDRLDFARLSEAEQFMFISNIKYQTLLDSVQGRSPVTALLPIVSLPELEAWVETWSFSETIHSRSYTHITRNVFTNPTEILDEITSTPEILARAVSVTEMYDKLIGLNAQSLLSPDSVSNYEHKKLIIKTLASINNLEAIRFYVSFACSFSFAERSLMEGNAKIIKLIARDEALHMAGTQRMLNHVRSGGEGQDWVDAYNEVLPDIKEMFKQTVIQEKEWSPYLFSKGQVIGLNVEILNSYIEYIADVRAKAIGLDPLFNRTTNPLPWTNKYLTSDNVQLAPQETETTSYLTGAMDSSIDSNKLSTLTL